MQGFCFSKTAHLLSFACTAPSRGANSRHTRCVLHRPMFSTGRPIGLSGTTCKAQLPSKQQSCSISPHPRTARRATPYGTECHAVRLRTTTSRCVPILSQKERGDAVQASPPKVYATRLGSERTPSSLSSHQRKRARKSACRCGSRHSDGKGTKKLPTDLH